MKSLLSDTDFDPLDFMMGAARKKGDALPSEADYY